MTTKIHERIIKNSDLNKKRTAGNNNKDNKNKNEKLKIQTVEIE